MLQIGQKVKVKVPEVLGLTVANVERTGIIKFIHWAHGWFMVEIRGKGGSYRTCYHLPANERLRHESQEVS